MFTIIVKNNCETCRRALNYFEQKKIRIRKINVDLEPIPNDVILSMERIKIDEEQNNFVGLKSFVRFKSPYFKARKVEPIMMTPIETRTRVISNPQDILSFPIILMFNGAHIINYLVGFSNSILDRWLSEPAEKNFYNLNRAYGDSYCCHECVLRDQNINHENEINNKINQSENFVSEKPFFSNSQSRNQSEFKDVFLNNFSNDRKVGKYNEERERIFKTRNYDVPKNAMLNEQFPRPIYLNKQNNYYSENRKMHNENFANNNDFSNMKTVRHNVESVQKNNDFSNSNNIRHNVKPIQKNLSNLPRIYNEKSHVDVQKIISQIQDQNNSNLNNVENQHFLNKEKEVIQNTNNQEFENKIHESFIIRRIGIGEEIGQPEFANFNQKTVVKKETQKIHVKKKGTSVHDFLDEIKDILEGDNKVVSKSLDEKLYDYGIIDESQNELEYLNDSKIEKIKNKLPKNKKFSKKPKANDYDEIGHIEIDKIIKRINEKTSIRSKEKENSSKEKIIIEKKNYFEDIQFLDDKKSLEEKDFFLEEELTKIKNDLLLSSDKLKTEKIANSESRIFELEADFLLRKNEDH